MVNFFIVSWDILPPAEVNLLHCGLFLYFCAIIEMKNRLYGRKQDIYHDKARRGRGEQYWGDH